MAELSVHPSESLIITRTLAAPRELVFRAFTEAERLGRWWGPKGVKIEVQRLDLRPGGLFHYAMVHPDGTRWWGRFEFREISPPQRLIWINSFSDPDGGLSRPPFAPGFPLRVLNVVTLDEHAEGRTTLTLRSGPLDASPEEIAFFAGMHEGMRLGFGGTFDQLEAHLADAG